MKTLHKFCAAALLTMILALSALAEDGQMNCPGIASRPPAPTTAGQVDCPGVAQTLLLTLETVLLLA